MAEVKPKPIFIYVDRQNLLLCVAGSSQVITVNLPDAAVKDLEIKNLDELNNRLKEVIDQNKIVPDGAYLIMGKNTLFEAEFTGLEEGVQKDQLDQFVATIPFENTQSKIFKVGKKNRLIVLNRRFYENLGDILKNLGFSLIGVTPESVLDDKILAGGFTAKACQVLFGKLDFLRQNSYLYDETAMQVEEAKTSPNPLKNRQLLLLLLIFLALMAVLGFLVKFNILDKKPPVPKTVTNTAPASPAPIPPVTPPPAAVDLQTVKINILNASGSPGASLTANNLLLAAGFKQVTAQNVTTTSGASDLIYFNPDVSTTVREKVLSAVTVSFPKTTTKELPNANFDVVITLTKIAP